MHQCTLYLLQVVADFVLNCCVEMLSEMLEVVRRP